MFCGCITSHSKVSRKYNYGFNLAVSVQSCKLLFKGLIPETGEDKFVSICTFIGGWDHRISCLLVTNCQISVLSITWIIRTRMLHSLEYFFNCNS